MGYSFNLTLMSDGESIGPLAGSFDDRESGLLDEYLSQFEVLQSCRPVRDGFFRGFKLVMDERDSEPADEHAVERELVSILLHELRPFVLDNEPASFSRISGIVGRRAQAQPVREFLKRNRKLYDGRISQSIFTVAIDDVVVNSEATLQSWLNGQQYHRDADKAAEVEALFGALGETATVGIFLSLLDHKVSAIGTLAGLIKVLVGRSTSMSFQA